MIRNLLLSLAFVFVASAASAQTVEMTIDVTFLGWGPLDIIRVETDGNPDTEEWLVFRFNLIPGGEGKPYRVVAIRPSGLCWGEWFHPAGPNPGFFASHKLELHGRINKFRVQQGWMTTVFKIVTLDTPTCN